MRGVKATSLGFLNQDLLELCLIREFKPRSKRRYHLIKSEVSVVYHEFMYTCE
jgi:hypothetical protein